MSEAGWLAAVRRRDPHGLALRLGVRLALVVPVVLVGVQAIPWLSKSAIYASFAALALLLFSDFGGPLPRRASNYLITTAFGALLILIAAPVSATVWPAALAMFAIALFVTMTGVLRGPFAQAQVTLLLTTVLALTDPSTGQVLQDVVAWTIGGLAATAAALLLWPSRPQRTIRRQLRAIYLSAAELARNRWTSSAQAWQPEQADELAARVTKLRARLTGDLTRPGSASSFDRALVELTHQADRIVAYQRWVDVESDRPEALREIDAQLAAVCADGLGAVAERLSEKESGGGAQEVVDARTEHLTATLCWADAAPQDLPAEQLRSALDDSFPVRATANATEVALRSSVGLLHLHSLPRQWWRRLRTHTTLASPWFRNGIRTAVALAAAIGLANQLSLGHAFWVVLGTLSALRFDAIGTGRTAWQGLLGTTAGVVIAAGLIVVIGDVSLVWLALLPLCLFITAFARATFPFPVGQAAFSVLVIVLFTYLSGAELLTAELRLLEVGIGLAVAYVISLALWPRGVAAMLRKRTIEGLDAALDYLVATVDYVIGGFVDARQLQRQEQLSAEAAVLAEETFDLAVAQRPRDPLPLSSWADVSLMIGHVQVSAKALGRIGGGDIGGAHHLHWSVDEAVAGPLLMTANRIRDVGRRAVRVVGQQSGDLAKSGSAGGDSDADRDEVMALASDGSVQTVTTARLRSAIELQIERRRALGLPQVGEQLLRVTWMADSMAMVAWQLDQLDQLDQPDQPDQPAIPASGREATDAAPAQSE